MRIIAIFLSICFSLVCSNAVRADVKIQSSEEADDEFFVVGKIEFVGLKRTQADFVSKELGFSSGDKVSEDMVDAGVQRLRNTNFFVSVDVQTEQAENMSLNIRFIFREKWTLTPVLRGGSGGGIEFLVLGLYDLNLLGRGIEAGLQYERYAGAGGINLWWRQPHFVRPVWRTAVEFQSGRRPFFYLNPRSNIYSTPLARSTRLMLSAQRRLSAFDLGVGLEPFFRELASPLVDPMAEYSNFSRKHEEGVSTRLFFRFNGMALDDYLWEGHRVELAASNIFSANAAVQPFVQSLALSGTHFWSLFERQNFGLRWQAQWSNAQSLLSLFRLGSLDAVRGLDDGERIGSVVWSVNAEERWVAYVSQNVVLQSVVFADAGNAGKSFREWSMPVASSVGLGLRLGFRPIARLRLRADYARALSGLRHPESWIVGMQHYF